MNRIVGVPANQPPHPRDLLGSRLADRYELVELIDQGGAALVFRAVHLSRGREVAIKLLRRDPKDATRLGERMLREARIAASLCHPGIAEVYDAGVTPEGWHFIAMELLQGCTLRRYLDDVERLSPAETVRILEQVCAAVQAVHDRGYVHRDIKPTNVFLANDGTGRPLVKLLDFGTVRGVTVSDEMRANVRRTIQSIAKRSLHTVPGIVLGTPEYMSPEQVAGEELGPPSDVYALAVLAYEMLLGAPPFADPDPAHVLALQMVAEPDPMWLRAPHALIPKALDEVVCDSLAKEPADRPQSARELARQLREAIAEKPASALPPSAPTRHAQPRRLASWLILAFTAIGLLIPVVAALVVLSLWRSPGADPVARGASAVDTSERGTAPVIRAGVDDEGPAEPAMSEERGAGMPPPQSSSAKAHVTEDERPRVGARPLGPGPQPVSSARARSARPDPTRRLGGAADSPPLPSASPSQATDYRLYDLKDPSR